MIRSRARCDFSAFVKKCIFLNGPAVQLPQGNSHARVVKFARRQRSLGITTENLRASIHEQKNNSSGKGSCGRRGASRRQIHFASLRHARGNRPRRQRTQQLCARGGLSQYARLLESAGRGSESRQEFGARDRPWVAWIERQPSCAGCWKFRNYHPATVWNSCGTEFHHENCRRRLAQQASDETHFDSAARDG